MDMMFRFPCTSVFPLNEIELLLDSEKKRCVSSRRWFIFWLILKSGGHRTYVSHSTPLALTQPAMQAEPPRFRSQFRPLAASRH